jgi:hypothetical protein
MAIQTYIHTPRSRRDVRVTVSSLSSLIDEKNRDTFRSRVRYSPVLNWHECARQSRFAYRCSVRR